MKKTLLLLLLLPVFGFAQVADDFSDGDFSQNPAWTGTSDKFAVNADGQLQLNAAEAGTAWLALPITESESMEWRFWIREAFSPSANNFTDVWLAANDADLSQATQGYFVRFGETGSADAIELFRKDNGGQQSICRGREAAIANAFAVSVKVNCDRDGHWTLQTCYDNSGIYSTEANGIDQTLAKNGFFGLHATFTSSNAKRVYLDNVYVGPTIVDNEPPQLLTTEVVGNQSLVVSFNEALDETALEAAHYAVDHGIGNPETAVFGETLSKVVLGFANVFENNVNYTLTISDLSDLAGNVMETASTAFSIFEAAPNDVVINEIMADPTPVVGLPEWEFVELYNTTDLSIDLKDWTIGIGTTIKTFGTCTIAPHGYLIVCHTNAVEELSAYGTVCGLLTSSTAITNGGTNIRLSNPQGNVVSEVAFDVNWYHDSSKTEGGWTLEQIDPYAPCAGATNWTASVDPSGGTPGRINSVDGENSTTPRVERVSMESNNDVQLWFDQLMDTESLGNAQNYLVEETGERPRQVETNVGDRRFVKLHFAQGFEDGLVYTLIINNLTNCIGTTIAADTRVRFGLPNDIAEGEIIINEILFDPIAPGVDYVELYNNSDKTFDLNTLQLGVTRESFPNPADTTLKDITAESRLILPRTYVLLSANSEIVGHQYGCPTDNYVQMASFPSYANAGGTAILRSKAGIVIDAMSFSEKMHYPLLKVTKGVSLERVSFDQPSMAADNWNSAAERVGFGTPGQPNSMMQSPEVSQDEIGISPEVFSPDGDGYDDACFVNYRFDEGGYTMNTYIFNVAGQLVRHLAKGELVGQEGSVVWNGFDNNGNRVPVGVYVVMTEVFGFDGKVKQFKNAVVVATR